VILISESNVTEVLSPINRSQLISREGSVVDASTDVWNLPYTIYPTATVDFGKIENKALREVTREYIAERLVTTSTHAAYTAFTYLWTEFFSVYQEMLTDDLEASLVRCFEKMLNRARSNHRLWAMYRPIRWFIWCADNYPENGFSIDYSFELEAISIPGNPKGEAVRLEDPDKGPLNRSIELPLLISAMKEDKCDEYEHLQQRAIMALSIAYGRNPANLTYLKEIDLKNIAPVESDPCFILRIPRIKKRLLNPRDDFLDEYLNQDFANYLIELIEASKQFATCVDTGSGMIEVERPLFFKRGMNQAAIRAQQWDSAYNLTTKDVGNLIKAFVKRHNIISPITGELMHVTPRRLRYTMATGLAAEGISKRELARILDHTDTQHVNVYFEMAGRIVEHLDKATAKGFSKYLNFFKGRLIDSDEDAVNGERDDKHLTFVDDPNPADQADIGVCGESSVCHLDPPYSCYLCPKFQPYRHADHEHVLECLLAGREERLKKYENARLGIQLDEVIAAVAQVVKLCEVGAHNV